MKRQRKKHEFPKSNWTTEQDCYLIENSNLPINELMRNLPYSDDEIIDRKEILGLVRRARQMRKGV
ncbi:acyl-CoA thioesterase [Acinetobacter bereziniae]|uniref:acyl-CoA thioesterase n=1 Tax=Acinetobacter bereziniae TaxID=106648 RepID=UPI0022EA3942|nr:acyl-CoA thioesterase [Acinetobacter bereziniae]MDA3442659.1 acyl-CoA thioesterase [Acinetobacter bereziniae]